jgi:hypothetical protein
MGSTLLVRRGGTAGAASTDFTSYAPYFPAPSSTDPYIGLGMRFANGEASQGRFLIRDLLAALPKADLTFNLPTFAVVLWTENASGSTVWLARGRVQDSDNGRGVPRGGDPVEHGVVYVDGNTDVRDLDLRADWVRPEETDYARMYALAAAFLAGSPRPSTVISFSDSHLAPNTNTVTMPAKTYQAGTGVAEIIEDCRTSAGKVWGVVIHHTGGSHLCLQYIIETDHTTYASTVKISDHIADVDETATPPIYAPRWLAGKPTRIAGEDQVSTIISRYGADTTSFVVVDETVHGTADNYDYRARRYDDSDSVNATQAAARAAAILDYQRLARVTHQVSVAVPADKTTLLAAGMSIQIKAAAALGGQYLNTYQTRRIAQLIWEPRNDGFYWAHMELDRSLKRAPATRGKYAPASTVPTPPSGGTAPTEFVNWTWSEPGPGYPSGFNAYEQTVDAYPSISQSGFTMGNGDNNSYPNLRSHTSSTAIPKDVSTKYIPCTVGTDISLECDIGSRNGGVENVTLSVNWYTSGTSLISSTSLFNASLGAGTPNHVTATLTPPATAVKWTIVIKGRIDNVTASSGGASGDVPAGGVGTGNGIYANADHNHDHGDLLDLNQPTDHPFFTEHAGDIDAHLQAKYDATGPPAVTNDQDEGYEVGSIWVDIANLDVYMAFDVTVGAAVWEQLNIGGAAPTTADYLVGTTQAGLSAEIVVGTSPGGELGGTWASPTVDATHSGSAHHLANSVRKNSAGSTFTRTRLNLIEGSNVSLTVADDSGTDEVDVTITSSATGTDELAKVSSNDTTAGYLNGKLVAGTGTTLTENNDGANETLTITSTAGGGAPGFHGASIYHNANQAISSTTEAELLLNSEEYDTDG